jgi:hypothetical protein
MEKDKLDILVMNIEYNQETDHLKIISAGNHKLTIGDLKDTIHESIDMQFEDLEKKMIETGKEFDNGLIILPLVKINFKKE